MIVQLFDVCNDYSHDPALHPMNLTQIAFHYTDETKADMVDLCKRFASGVTYWIFDNDHQRYWGHNKYSELTHCIAFRE